MTHVILPDAQGEFDNAVHYLNHQSEGLGLEFRQEVLDTLRKIINDPEQGSLYDAETRYRPVNRFRYLVIYTIRNGSTLIVAIMHESRSPGYWKKRLQDDSPQD